MNITWYGAASLLIESSGERILFDPFVQFNGGENPNSLEDFIHEEYICITHGHLDHLMEVPEFLYTETPGEATVYCGSVAARSLEEQGLDCSNVVLVRPGMCWKIGEIQLEVFKAEHAVPGWKTRLRTVMNPKMGKYMLNALFLASAKGQYPEGGETFMYELRAEGLRVQILGSLGLDREENYRPGADLLVLPFQGTDCPEKKALEIVERLKPRRILLDHFDDAFPPVSRTVDTRKFKQLMDTRYPYIPIVKPTAAKTVTIGL